MNYQNPPGPPPAELNILDQWAGGARSSYRTRLVKPTRPSQMARCVFAFFRAAEHVSQKEEGEKSGLRHIG